MSTTTPPVCIDDDDIDALCEDLDLREELNEADDISDLLSVCIDSDDVTDAQVAYLGD